jgi:peptide chain release factor 2
LTVFELEKRKQVLKEGGKLFLKEKIEKEIAEAKSLLKQVKDLKELAELFKSEQSFKEDLYKEYEKIEREVKEKEREIFFSGPYDKEDATLSIFAGVGGRDSEDWVAMLFRMYQRYCEIKNFKTKVLDISYGEPGPEGRIGIKSVTLEIKGKYAFGTLKHESGVHRLVRISPFSPNALRHTSFALVEVLPSLEKKYFQFEIKPSDLKLEFFKASGPGGQYVNKRMTAVRIVHLPTGIQACCQSERSQAQNKERALQLLYAKLLALMEREKEKEIDKIRGKKPKPSFGNQIRNYILHPYKLVKDLRTKLETTKVKEVLDGELLDIFIEEEIKILSKKNETSNT